MSILIARCCGLLLCAAAWSCSCAVRSEASEPSPQPAGCEKCINILLKTLEQQPKWIKVHAAEYLLELGYRAEVREEFRKELVAAGDEPQYRVGIWRVLARASENVEDRERYVKLIVSAAVDRAGPDRLHAVETLAKLRAPLSPDQRDEIRAWTSSAPAAEAPFGAWLLAASTSAAERDEHIESLLAAVGSEGAVARARASYALSRLEPLPQFAEAELLQLSEASNQPSAPVSVEAEVAAAQVFVLRKQVALPPEKFKAELRSAVRPLKHSSPAVVRFYCDQLANYGDEADAAALAPYLEAADPDVAASAAFAILSISRRQVPPANP